MKTTEEILANKILAIRFAEWCKENKDAYPELCIVVKGDNITIKDRSAAEFVMRQITK